MGLTEPLTFLKQTVRSFRTTGAIAPSSPFLAKAMAKHLPRPRRMPGDFRVLEVGPGTGSLTEGIVKRMDGRGHLELWEINPEFVAHLENRIASEKRFEKMREQITVRLGNVMALPKQPAFHAIVSGLPMNNFTPEEVRGFLEQFRALLFPGGTLTYFEYYAIRRLQAPFVNDRKRKNLKAIARIVEEYASRHQIQDQIVPFNVPPARVRHFCFSPTGPRK